MDLQAWHLVLEKCANVEQTIAVLRAFPITYAYVYRPRHVLLADRLGASAVVEFLPEGVVVSRADTPYQVMTNSYWAGPSDQTRCWRYQRAVEILESRQGQMDTGVMRAVMASIHSSTQWTSVYDLQDLTLILTLQNDNFSTQYKFYLEGFIARMKKMKKRST